MKLWTRHHRSDKPLDHDGEQPSFSSNAPHRHTRNFASTGKPIEGLDALVPKELKIVMKTKNPNESEVLAFLDSVRPDLAEMLRESFRHRKSGHGGIGRAIMHTVYKNAAAALDGVRRMHEFASEGKLAVALPVPPHVQDQLGEIDDDLVFAAEDHLPPHLENAGIQQLEELMPKEILERFANVSGLLVEGQIREGVVSTRRSIVEVLQLLPESANLTLFVHNMPHRPPHAEFKKVERSVQVVEIP